jgi:bifunctional NMN adenylyltransferase/nudix hydrolase
MKPFKLGMILGRFNHIHLGHQLMIDSALKVCDKVLLLVGSSQECGTERNPFSLYTRMNLIRDMYQEEIQYEDLLLGHIDDMTNENDHSTDWGEFVLKKVDMWRGHYGVNDKLDCIISGTEEDRMLWFDKDSVQGVGQLTIPKEKMNISATEMRKYLTHNDYAGWKDYQLFNNSSKVFKELRKELLQIPYYKELENNGENN